MRCPKCLAEVKIRYFWGDKCFCRCTNPFCENYSEDFLLQYEPEEEDGHFRTQAGGGEKSVS